MPAADLHVQVAVALDAPAHRWVCRGAHRRRLAVRARVDMIAVDPASQGQGVGHALTEHALSQIRDAGCDLAVVKTGGDDGHAPARALYESEGFTALPLVRYYRRL